MKDESDSFPSFHPSSFRLHPFSHRNRLPHSARIMSSLPPHEARTMADSASMQDLGPRAELLFAFCRMQLPAVAISFAACGKHLERTFGLFRTKADPAATWPFYLDHLYPVDWFLASACLEGDGRAWEALFA